MTIARLDVLFVENKIYKCGDMITVVLKSGNEICGKIRGIYDEDITIDCSKEFKSCVKQVNFEDIRMIGSESGVEVDWFKGVQNAK